MIIKSNKQDKHSKPIEIIFLQNGPQHLKDRIAEIPADGSTYQRQNKGVEKGYYEWTRSKELNEFGLTIFKYNGYYQ